MLIEARDAAGLTQKQLCALIGRPQSYVSNYERGAGRGGRGGPPHDRQGAGAGPEGNDGGVED